MSPYARRVDAPHKAVMQALRKTGWIVFDTSRIGRGFPDLVMAKAGRVVFVEVKDGTKPPSARQLTNAEAKFYNEFLTAGAQVRIVNSVSDALAL